MVMLEFNLNQLNNKNAIHFLTTPPSRTFGARHLPLHRGGKRTKKGEVSLAIGQSALSVDVLLHLVTT